MIEKDHGHIVTIASLAGHVGISKLVDYCSSKFAAVSIIACYYIEVAQVTLAFVYFIFCFFPLNRLDLMKHYG